jgi:hypothetical protein
LLGIRDSKPRLRPGSEEAEAPPLRQWPSLRGRLVERSELGERLESVEEALRPGLAGRSLGQPMRAAEPGLRRPPVESVARRDERETAQGAPAADFVGDGDLFTAERLAPPVIERPAHGEPVTVTQAALRPADRPDHRSV